MLQIYCSEFYIKPEQFWEDKGSSKKIGIF